jgi:hypothetical protein
VRSGGRCGKITTSLWAEFPSRDGRTIHKWQHYFPAYETHFGRYMNRPHGGRGALESPDAPGQRRADRHEASGSRRGPEEDCAHVRIGARGQSGLTSAGGVVYCPGGGVQRHRDAGAAGRNPPRHWVTTLRAAPREGTVRPDIRALAARSLQESFAA